MSKNSYDLHESRLGTTDEKGRRVYMHPEDIKGKWKTYRSYFYYFLILVYLVVPWIYVDGKQWILLNLPAREFTFFGYTFYGHDGPLLIFILLGFVFTLAFVTSIWGRVWCGWACPQTVFIDAVYRRVERWIEGNARRRKALDESPWNAEKIFKRVLKWFAFIVITLHIVHSFLGYFVGTHRLFWITMGNPMDSLPLFITMLVLTAILLFDFGWFREQFCIIACPYGRFQSVIMDDSSLVVAYDTNRGEPRRAKDVPKDQEGDCIDCKRCVKACPTGIDIRRGIQLECIACTMCIDACDEIMLKLNRPTGLVKYTTENELRGEKKKISARSYIYATLAIVAVIGLAVALSKRGELSAQVLRGGKVPFQLIQRAGQEPTVVNHLKVKIHNYQGDPITVNFELTDRSLEMTSPFTPMKVTGANNQADVFVRFPKAHLLNGHAKTELIIFEEGNRKNVLKTLEVKLVGPF